MVEIFFRVLKSGCRVEERLFEQMDRLLTCLAVYIIVAWRTLYVCRLGRSCPEVSCEVVFEPAEWKSVWKVVHHEDPSSPAARPWECLCGSWHNSAATSTESEPIHQDRKPSGSGFNACMTLLPAGNFLVPMPKRNP